MQPRLRCSPALIYVITLPLTNEKHRGRGCTCSPAPGAAPPRSAGCSRVLLDCRALTADVLPTATHTYMQTYTHTSTHMHTKILTHADLRAHTHTLSLTYSLTHTHTHTHIFLFYLDPQGKQQKQNPNTLGISLQNDRYTWLTYIHKSLDV